jgi:hypothetical protein
MSVLQKLTEGIVDRDLSKEGTALLNKWEQTGLLEGLTTDRDKNYMSRLLENQAKELLREASTMSGQDVEGFAAVAFPIVRRVFGGLIANDLVSVQPMSLPSGLIFFMDFTVADTKSGLTAGDSIYGGDKVASGIATGIDELTEDGGGMYNLQSGYSSPTGSIDGALTAVAASALVSALSDEQLSNISYDPDVLSLSATHQLREYTFDTSASSTGLDMDNINLDNLIAVTEIPSFTLTGNGTIVRRLTRKTGANQLTLVVTHDGAVTVSA